MRRWRPGARCSARRLRAGRPLGAGFEDGGHDRLDHLADDAGKRRVVLHDVDRGGDGAAGLVPEDHDQGHPEDAHRVLDAAQGRRIHGVAGVAHDEQLAEAPAEEDLRRHTAVGAAHEHAERSLSPGEFEPALTAVGRKGRRLVPEVLVALLHELEGVGGLQRCLRGGRRGPGGLGREGGRGEEPGRPEQKPPPADPRPAGLDLAVTPVVHHGAFPPPVPPGAPLPASLAVGQQDVHRGASHPTPPLRQNGCAFVLGAGRLLRRPKPGTRPRAEPGRKPPSCASARWIARNTVWNRVSGPGLARRERASAGSAAPFDVPPPASQGSDMADTVADFFWKRLAEWGVTKIFGYPGDGINGLLGALQRTDLPFEFIQVRHEEMAAFMATAYSKFSGEIGVCLATSGPGATHLLTGMYDAHLDHVPMLAICGQQARNVNGAHYQQEFDLTSVFKDVSGYVQQASSPAQVRHIVDRAMRIANAERKVSTIILPNDLQDVPYEGPVHKHGNTFSGVGYTAPKVVPFDVDLRRAADVLNAGKKVAILVGAGALHATDEVIAVANRLQAGVAKALLGKAALPTTCLSSPAPSACSAPSPPPT